MIRPVTIQDTPVVLRLTAQTGVFKPMEIDTLWKVLDEYHQIYRNEGHRAFVFEEGEQVLGFTYYAPREMTENTWYLWWIAVDTTMQGKGIGAKLLSWVEEDVKQLHGRVLMIETSSLPHYQPTRKFYEKKGYDTVGCLPDFYADGDDMVIFQKRIASRPS